MSPLSWRPGAGGWGSPPFGRMSITLRFLRLSPGHAVVDTRFGEDVLRVVGIVAQLVPEPLDHLAGPAKADPSSPRPRPSAAAGHG